MFLTPVRVPPPSVVPPSVLSSLLGETHVTSSLPVPLSEINAPCRNSLTGRRGLILPSGPNSPRRPPYLFLLFWRFKFLYYPISIFWQPRRKIDPGNLPYLSCGFSDFPPPESDAPSVLSRFNLGFFNPPPPGGALRVLTAQIQHRRCAVCHP